MIRNDPTLDAQTKACYRAALSRHVPSWSAPSAVDEARDRRAAEATYDSAARWLREQTRDRRRYTLVFKENVSNGFRRNLYALKPVGLPLAILCSLGNVGATYHAMIVSGATVPVQGIASLALSLLAIVGWGFVVRPAWFRDAAAAYARALLATCDTL